MQNSGVRGKELNRLVAQIATLFSQHNERIAEKFEGELDRNLLLSSDAQERNEAILKCIGIMEKETGLVLSTVTTWLEE